MSGQRYLLPATSQACEAAICVAASAYVCLCLVSLGMFEATVSLASNLWCSLAIQSKIGASQDTSRSRGGHFLGTFALVALASAAKAAAELRSGGDLLVPRALATFVFLSVAATNLKYARWMKAPIATQVPCLLSVCHALGHLYRIQVQHTWFATICIPLAYLGTEITSLLCPMSRGGRGASDRSKFAFTCGDALLIPTACLSVVLKCFMDWHLKWTCVHPQPAGTAEGRAPATSLGAIFAQVLAPLRWVLSALTGTKGEPPVGGRDLLGVIDVLVQAELLFSSVLFIVLVARVCAPLVPQGERHQDPTRVAVAALACFLGALLYVAAMAGLVTSLTALKALFFDIKANANLVLLWLAILCCTVPVLLALARGNVVRNIVIRKLFHISALPVFASAIYVGAHSEGDNNSWSVSLLRFCSAGLLCLFVLCEFVRVQCQDTAFSAKMTEFFTKFTDARDSGTFILSHLSLLLGLSSPFWVNLRGGGRRGEEGAQGTEMALLSSGLLVLGVGDVLGVAVGTTVGHVAVCRGSQKTVEGTSAAILGSVFFGHLWIEAVGGDLVGGGGGAQFFALAAAAGLLEAFTTQLDNLYVPLFFYATLLCGSLLREETRFDFLSL